MTSPAIEIESSNSTKGTTAFTSPTYLEELTLKNFRCFDELTIQFHPQLTVIVAPNGGGKTAILDAIAIALQSFVLPIREDTPDIIFEEKDIHLCYDNGKMRRITPFTFSANANFEEKQIKWEKTYKEPQRGRPSKSENPLAEYAEKFHNCLQTPQSCSCILPLIAYQGTGRLHEKHRLRKIKEDAPRGDTLRERGYKNCLSSLSNYKFFAEWFERFSRERQAELQDGENSPHRPSEKLAAIGEVLNAILAPVGWRDLKFDFANNRIVASHKENGTLPVEWLSAGIRSIIALAGDLAYRCLQLNPDLNENAIKQTPGIVLIDEVDMHLHPEWQQTILESLQNAFPLVQFIVTTHSPAVLTTVRAENTRKILCVKTNETLDEMGKNEVSNAESKWLCETPKQADSPFLADITSPLSSIMEVNPRPQITQKQKEFLEKIHRFEIEVRNGNERESNVVRIKEEIERAGYAIPPSSLALWRFVATKKKKEELSNG